MDKKIIKDLGASIKQRLLNFAREKGRPFNEVLQYYMIERFIDRLSKSVYILNLVQSWYITKITKSYTLLQNRV